LTTELVPFSPCHCDRKYVEVTNYPETDFIMLKLQKIFFISYIILILFVKAFPPAGAFEKLAEEQTF